LANNWSRLTRKLHHWTSIVVALPFLIILLSGILLQVKKQVSWVQPTTLSGQGDAPQISFSKILEIAREVPEAEISDWDDVARLDVRPGKGIVKVRAKNNWEIQLDHQTGEVLQVEYRRSDTIESIHDGSFFHVLAKPWLFLVFAAGLLLVLVTGVYMFLLPYSRKKRARGLGRT
jgi:uncharacterized iron-regulated membrane protein